jgi:hypothetical protein
MFQLISKNLLLLIVPQPLPRLGREGAIQGTLLRPTGAPRPLRVLAIISPTGPRQDVAHAGGTDGGKEVVRKGYLANGAGLGAPLLRAQGQDCAREQRRPGGATKYAAAVARTRKCRRRIAGRGGAPWQGQQPRLQVESANGVSHAHGSRTLLARALALSLSLSPSRALSISLSLCTHNKHRDGRHAGPACLGFQ